MKVDHDGTPGGGDPLIDEVRHGLLIWREESTEECMSDLLVIVPQPQPARGARVDGTHADFDHHLVIVGQPLGVHDQAREAVQEQPWPGRDPIGGKDGQLVGARVGHEAQLLGECVVVEQDLRPDVVRDRGGRVGHVDDVWRGGVTWHNLKIHRRPPWQFGDLQQFGDLRNQDRGAT